MSLCQVDPHRSSLKSHSSFVHVSHRFGCLLVMVAPSSSATLYRRMNGNAPFSDARGQCRSDRPHRRVPGRIPGPVLTMWVYRGPLRTSPSSLSGTLSAACRSLLPCSSHPLRCRWRRQTDCGHSNHPSRQHTSKRISGGVIRTAPSGAPRYTDVTGSLLRPYPQHHKATR